MSNGVLLSIIVPVYNIESYIEKCIVSIINQTFSSWQLILIDDGSTDRSSFICDQYARKDYRVSVIHQSNMGVSCARNVGIKHALGEYISFVDGDDWIEPELYTECFQEIFDQFPDILLCPYVDDYGGKLKRNKFSYMKTKKLNVFQAQKELLRQKFFSWSPFAKLYKRELIGNCRFDSNISIGEDLFFNWEIIKKGQSIFYAPICKYHYVHRLGSATTDGFSEKHLSVLIVKQRICDDAKCISIRHYLLARAIYIVELVGIGKKILQSEDLDKYQSNLKICISQIRKTWYYAMFIFDGNVISRRVRYGIIYFMLPYLLIKKLRKYTYKSGELYK